MLVHVVQEDGVYLNVFYAFPFKNDMEYIWFLTSCLEDIWTKSEDIWYLNIWIWSNTSALATTRRLKKLLYSVAQVLPSCTSASPLVYVFS